jgi:hypothetical protein
MQGKVGSTAVGAGDHSAGAERVPLCLHAGETTRGG